MNFDTAFAQTMQFEIGPWFNPNDLEVQRGLCKTVIQKRKTGFSDNKKDRGGLTKFGIAQASHPNVDVLNLTLEQAKKIYYEEFWVCARCSELPCYANAMFDAAVNHGVTRGIKLLQQTLGTTVDGQFGPTSMKIAKEKLPSIAPDKFMKSRRDFYNSIVTARPDQKVFLNGWLARCSTMEKLAWTEQNSR